MQTFAQKQNQLHKPVSSSLDRPHLAPRGPDHREHPLLHLQRTIGNQAVQRMVQTYAEEPKAGWTAAASPRFGHDVSRLPIHPLAAKAIQTKLAINQPGDQYEQEADRVADQVITMPAHHAVSGALPHIQRFVGQPAEQTEAMPASVDQALASPGRPLEPGLRQDMEQRFGHDFSQVRVHSGAAAEQSARDVNAHAYTVGHDIVFGTGHSPSDTVTGHRMLRHELTHVVQQSGGDAKAPPEWRAAFARPSISASRVAVQRQKQEAEAKPSKPAPQASEAMPPSYTAHAAAPPKVDFGDVQTGTQRITSFAVWNLVNIGAALHVGYEGDPTIQLISSPTNIRASSEAMSMADREIKMVFDAPRKSGVHRGVVMLDFVWPRGEPPSETLAVPVVAQAQEEPPIAPRTVPCPPASGAGVKTLGEYIELVRCAEVKTGFEPRMMLALLRQMYYGKPWSATAQDPNWNFVIPCSPDVGNPENMLGQPLFDALHNSVTIQGTDLGHVFTGLESMTCPASSVTLEKTKFYMGIKLTVDLSNESFATWGGDVGSAAGAFVACWMMTDQERVTKGKDDCHQGRAPESLMQYFEKRQAPPEDLEGDIAPFVIRAAERGGCGGSLEQRFTPRAPISSIFTNFFYNWGPTGMTSRDRYQCFAEAIGANVVNGQITNRAALIHKYESGVLSFAWAYYVNLKKEIPRSDPIVPLLERNSRAALHLFFDWLQARMRP